MDLNAVRTFVVVAGTGQFQKAAVDLSLTQQAVSKRVAALERDLGVRLLTRTARGAELTIDGQVFLPHARALLDAEERAGTAVRPGSRALRVDVLRRRVSTAGLVRDFHRAHPDIPLDVVTLHGAEKALAAVRDGTVDATFRAVTAPGQQIPDGIDAVHVLDEPMFLCTGPGHPLADAVAVTPAQLAGHRIWMPGNEPGTEWAAYYDALAATFGLTIDTIGPNFGVDALLESIEGSSTVATLLSERTPLVWPAGYDLRLIPLRDPTPVYPHWLLWRGDNAHPGLAALYDYLTARRTGPGLAEGEVWTPGWARGVRR
ncbi:LysR family transcriptional regulator [Streptomyces sp. TRM68367]|uniref:LysR family transcriptional regulator n=1 Tax=Streptomyces sp. TRM68367 TaxID=2758415 RepID=UPI00165C5E09|nr:LysR family transcriptional regulator [Streptomyces sp. TRM68367]MBC9727478.1 LysR family transcriptional regulator [Streptomyces sp. TRM68367]